MMMDLEEIIDIGDKIVTSLKGNCVFSFRIEKEGYRVEYTKRYRRGILKPVYERDRKIPAKHEQSTLSISIEVENFAEKKYSDEYGWDIIQIDLDLIYELFDGVIERVSISGSDVRMEFVYKNTEQKIKIKDLYYHSRRSRRPDHWKKNNCEEILEILDKEHIRKLRLNITNHDIDEEYFWSKIVEMVNMENMKIHLNKKKMCGLEEIRKLRELEFVWVHEYHPMDDHIHQFNFEDLRWEHNDGMIEYFQQYDEGIVTGFRPWFEKMQDYMCDGRKKVRKDISYAGGRTNTLRRSICHYDMDCDIRKYHGDIINYLGRMGPKGRLIVLYQYVDKYIDIENGKQNEYGVSLLPEKVLRETNWDKTIKIGSRYYFPVEVLSHAEKLQEISIWKVDLGRIDEVLDIFGVEGINQELILKLTMPGRDPSREKVVERVEIAKKQLEQQGIEIDYEIGLSKVEVRRSE